MTAEIDRKALALYPFDGSDPNLILALHAAFRAGAEFAAERAPAWGEETLTNEALLLARAALAQASPSQSTPWVARLVDEVVDSTLAVVRDHLPVKPSREAMLLTLARADGQDWESIADASLHTAEIMYGAQATAVLALLPGRSEADPDA